MADEVASGLFKWLGRSDLDAIKAQYISAVKGHATALSSNGRLIIRGSGEGQSYESPEGISSLHELRQELEHAYAQLDDEDPPVNDRSVVTFR